MITSFMMEKSSFLLSPETLESWLLALWLYVFRTVVSLSFPYSLDKKKITNDLMLHIKSLKLLVP